MINEVKLNDLILSVIGRLRCVTAKNLYFILLKCYGSDYSIPGHFQNLQKILLNLKERGFLETIQGESLIDFSKLEQLENYFSKDIKKIPYFYYLTKSKGCSYVNDLNLILNIPVSFLPYNYNLYTIINSIFFDYIEDLKYSFDTSKFSRGIFKIHEIHASIDVELIKYTKDLDICFVNSRIGVKYLTGSELKPSFIKYFIEHIVAKSTAFDVIYFVYLNELFEIKFDFLDEYNRKYILKRLAYQKDNFPKNYLHTITADNYLNKCSTADKTNAGCPVQFGTIASLRKLLYKDQVLLG